jgi:hypothetical protein
MDEYKKLLKTQEEERNKLKEVMEVKNFISEKLNIPFKVYIGSKTYKVIDFKNLFREDNLSLSELQEILNTFKPLKRYMIKKGTLSFNVTEEEGAENKEINPYIINFEGLEEDKIIIKWFCKIEELIFEIRAHITNKSLIDKIAERTAERVEFKGGFRIENTTLKLKGKFSNSNYKVIKWVTGSNEYKNDFTIYTEDLRVKLQDYLY